MTSLPNRLKEFCEFKDSDSNMSGRDAMVVKGITIDAVNARMKPVLDALIECVEEVIKSKSYTRNEDLWNAVNQLEAVLKECGK